MLSRNGRFRTKRKTLKKKPRPYDRRQLRFEQLEDRRMLAPVIGVAKDASVDNREITLDFYLENLGDEELNTLSLPDNLDNVFGAGNYTIVSAPTLIDDPGTLTAKVEAL